MKFKKILSTALIAVSLFTCIASALPLTASAAYSQHTSTAVSTDAKAAIEAVKDNYSYGSAQEMLDAETALGYIDTYEMATESGSVYSLHINRYTGMMYYVDGTTGQILTSNPFDMSSIKLKDDSEYMMMLKSQILVKYNLNSQLSDKAVQQMTSYVYSAKKYQLSVTPITGGFRVNYTIGNTSSRFLFPSSITYRDFREQIFGPIYDRIMEILDTNLGGDRSAYDLFEMEEVKGKPVMLGDCFQTKAFQAYIQTTSAGLLTQQLAQIEDTAPEAYKEARALQRALLDIFNSYDFNNPWEWHADNKTAQLESMYKDIPLTMGESETDKNDDLTVLVRKDIASPDQLAISKIRAYSMYIREYCPDYTFADMDEDEEECGKKAEVKEEPIFRCALEYRIDADGTLLVELPANSITFDATKYTLRYISVLPFFGAGDMRDKGGYAFYPDGSGAIIGFEDIYGEQQKLNVQKQTSIYGDDYCYSNLTASRKLQVTMPVYGMVGEVPANAATVALSDTDAITEGSTVTNGFFTILEEGASLATLYVNTDSNSSPYMNMYTAYTPYAVDQFDLSATIMSASSDPYFVVSETPYAGSYTQRFVMLRDEAVAVDRDTYVASYIGMALYYRDYLEKNGVLTALDSAKITQDFMPLYLETIGSMEIDDTFLTFPIKRDIPLTSFEDVIKMYEALSEKGIKNINVRLTAYANGGIYSTYPVKLRWEKSVGGKRGFRELIDYANGLSRAEGEVLGLYPEFDFMYINYTSLFDGIGNKGNVTRMLDNRYTVRRVLDPSTNTLQDGFSAVIAGEALDRLYAKFLRKYQKYDVTGLSVSTMGSDLSSNFDEKGTVDRETQLGNVAAVLKKMSDQYSLMLDKGNAYALAYADHLLNANIDSSHFSYSSYTVPFVGMVLHGYVNYAGTALNNSGSPEYDILRSIENGASLYYILCYQNIEHMKKYEATNKYYSVDFHNWLDDVVASYHTLNDAIGGLQEYRINDHRRLIGERVMNAAERQTVYRELTDEFVAMVEAQLKVAIDEKMAEMQADGIAAPLAVDVVDIATTGEHLFAQYLDELHLTADNAEFAELFTYCKAELAELAATYEQMYPAVSGAETLSFASVEYASQYKYLTTSSATDDASYVSTIFTNDNGNIVLVTYTGANGEEESFILNYNIFAVTVNYNGHSYVLGAYDFTNTKDWEG